MSTDSLILLIAAFLFYIPMYTKLSYVKQPIFTIGFYLLFAAALSYLLKSYYILAFQTLIVFSQILHFNSHRFIINSYRYKNPTLAFIAQHIEKPVLLLVFILMVYLDLPLKTLLILALIGVRFFTYLKAFFPKNRILSQYMHWVITVVYLLALMFRNAL